MSPNKIKFLMLMSAFLAGLWLVACKTTPAPSTPVPPQPETSQTKDTRQSTSSEPAESGQPETSKTKETRQSTSSTPAEAAQPQAEKKSKTSQTPSPEATATQTPEAKEKSADRQNTSAGASETRPPETGQRVPQSRKTTPRTADDKLAKARDDLRVSQATEKRIADELEALKKSGNASDEDIRNYEAYLERVQAMVAENRKTVEKMESAYAEHPPHSPAQKTSSESPKLSDQQIPEEQTQDPVAELDRQLSASLTEFDAMLLKEMETIETESAAKMRDLAQEAAEAAKRLKEKGVDLGTDESKTADAQSSQSKEGQQGKTGEKDASRAEKGAETKQGDSDDKVATSDTSKGEGSGPTGDRGSRYSKEDDDIVARQLREAAENETDPELKEKLWKEYEEYKKNTQP
jgi:hypothetical protein